MNTIPTLKAILIAAGLLTSGLALAHGAQDMGPTPGTVIYTNAAYTHAIHGAPNPAPEVAMTRLEPIYVSQANGPAIYSYPSANADMPRHLCKR